MCVSVGGLGALSGCGGSLLPHRGANKVQLCARASHVGGASMWEDMQQNEAPTLFCRGCLEVGGMTADEQEGSQTPASCCCVCHAFLQTAVLTRADWLRLAWMVQPGSGDSPDELGNSCWCDTFRSLLCLSMLRFCRNVVQRCRCKNTPVMLLM